MQLKSDIAIDIKNLSKLYPGRVALSDISFIVKRGSIHGFLGPNGAGKSTTMKILSGLIKESGGEFTVNGKVGFLPEHPPLYPNMTVQDYLEFVQDIYSHGRDSVKEIMKKTGLMDVSERLIGNLSKGYQQRVGIAQALVHSPEIIILDEPTVGLDPVAIADIRKLILELKKDHTIIFSTHQLHDVELLCSDITLINHGKIVVSGTLEKILENLKTRMTIHAQVSNFDVALKNKMLNQFRLESLEFSLESENKEKEETYLIKITANAGEGLKKELTHFLADKSIGLLEFGEVRLDLEELFKQMVH